MMIHTLLIMAIICLTYSTHAYSSLKVNNQEFLNIGRSCPTSVLPSGSQGYITWASPSNPFGVNLPDACIMACQKDLVQGQILLATGFISKKTCYCFFGQLDTPGKPIPCSLFESVQIKLNYYIPRYTVTLSLGSYELAGDKYQVESRFSYIGPKFKSYVEKYLKNTAGQGPTEDQHNNHAVWKGNYGNYCLYRFTQTFDYGVHRCRSGPQDTPFISTTIVWTPTLYSLGAYNSFYLPMWNLYTSLKRAETGTYVDTDIRKTFQGSCVSGQCAPNGLMSYAQETMYALPRSMLATMWDNNYKLVLGSVTFTSNYGRLIHPCTSLPASRGCQVLTDLETPSTILGQMSVLATAGAGFAIQVLGWALFIGVNIACSKMPEKTEDMESLVKNRFFFCNNLAANNASGTIIEPDELEMCNRLIWQPEEWFHKSDENKIAGSMLESNCTTVDNRNITELVERFGIDENKLLTAQSKCVEFLEEYQRVPETPVPTSSEATTCEELNKISCKKRTDCKFVRGMCKTKKF